MKKNKILEIKNLTVNVGDFLLKDINLKVNEDDYIIILGNSGAGKSILLETIAGMYKSQKGEIYLNGKDITFEKIQKRGVGIVYQDNTLFQHMSVKKNLEYGLKNRKHTKKDIDFLTKEISKKTNITKLLNRSCREGLSGGEIQRISLARSLLTNPKLLLLDEPLSALDVQAREEMQNLLKKIHENGQPIIHVTHNPEEAFALATHLVIIEKGTITQQGTIYEVLNAPETKFIANIMGIKNFFKGSLEKYSDDLFLFKAPNLTFFVSKPKELESQKKIKNLMILSKDILVFKENELEDNKKLYKNFFEATVFNIIYKRNRVEITGKLENSEAYLSSTIPIEKYESMNLKLNQKIYLGFHPESAKVF